MQIYIRNITHNFHNTTIYNYHFEEQITAQSISFPYRLEQGPARGKNAIALLGNMGIDEKIVKQAERRAAEFETTGSWEKNKFLR